MRKYAEFILLTDASVMFLKLAKTYKVQEIKDTLDEQMLWIMNGLEVPNILETVAFNMQCSRPGETYIYTIVYEGEEPKTYISSEVLQYAFPVMLRQPLEAFEDRLAKMVDKKKVR